MIKGNDKLVFKYESPNKAEEEKLNRLRNKLKPQKAEITYIVVTKKGVVAKVNQEEDYTDFAVDKCEWGYGLHFEIEGEAQEVADMINESYPELEAEVFKEKF